MNTLINNYISRPSRVQAMILKDDYDSIYHAIKWAWEVDMSTSEIGGNMCVGQVEEDGGLKIKNPDNTETFVLFGQYIVKDERGYFHAYDENQFKISYTSYSACPDL